MSIFQTGLLLLLCAPYALAAWMALMHTRRDAVAESPAPHWVDPTNARFVAEIVDVELALRQAAAAVTPPARAHWVRIDLAMSTAMTLHIDPGALGMALRQTMLTAIRAALGGQVLVTVAVLGSQLHIRVTDDGPGTDQLDRETSTRGAEALIALQGGSIAVQAQPGRGTIVTMRLPLPGKVAGEVSEPDRPDLATSLLAASVMADPVPAIPALTAQAA